jgi:hypothetical protein
MQCSKCQAKTLGFMVSVQGGTRVLTVAVPRGRKAYCRPCGEAQIETLRTKEIAKHGRAR